MTPLRCLPLALALVFSALAATAAPAQADRPFVTFERAGGYPFTYDLISVERDGRMSATTLHGAKTSQVGDKRLGKLRRALRRAKWATLDHAYEAFPEVADAYRWAVHYRDKTVTGETEAEIPRDLRRVITWFSRRIDA